MAEPLRDPESQFVQVAKLPQALTFARFIPIRNGKLDHSRAVPLIEFDRRPA